MTMPTSTRVASGREEMSTLSRGWRFTIPASLREALNWEEGARLDAFALGRTLLLTIGRSTSGEGRAEGGPISGEQPHSEEVSSGRALGGLGAPVAAAQCRMTEDGKVTVPRSIREALRWEIGKHLVLTLAEDVKDGLKVTPCCAIKRCSSCGGTDQVIEVIPNIYLCRSCWAGYRERLRLTPRPDTPAGGPGIAAGSVRRGNGLRASGR